MECKEKKVYVYLHSKFKKEQRKNKIKSIFPDLFLSKLH